MGLLQNRFRHSLTGRMFGATAIGGTNPSMLRGTFGKPAYQINRHVGEGINSALASVPNGAKPPYVWVMAREPGAMKSYQRGGLTIEGAAVGEKGAPVTASGVITITGTAAAGLIVSATGTAVLSIDGVAAIVATVGTTGQVTITINGAVALGAEASLTGTGTITIDGHVDAIGLGYMTGTTEEAGLTPSGVARAVWAALAADNNDTGTMGKLLNMAGSGGVDYTALANAILNDPRFKNVLTTGNFLALKD